MRRKTGFAAPTRLRITLKRRVSVSGVRGADIEPVAAMHVLRLGDELAVQFDPRDGVQTVADEVDPLVVEHFLIGIEGRAILPVGMADPSGLKLIQIAVGIRDFPRAK